MLNKVTRSAITPAICVFAAFAISGNALADDNHTINGPIRADGHAPIGVMGEHTHKRGEWMLSYRFMSMGMKGNLIGDNNVSPETIITTIPNRFGTPPTLRVVPTKMTMDMHMLGAMFAPTDNLTLMAMVPIIEKTMDHVTFQGMMGTTRLGTFTTRSQGLGDLKFSGLYNLYNDGTTKIHLNAGISVPTGSITKSDDVLTPMNTTPTIRLPYAMQLGTGTWDLLPGLTIRSNIGDLSFGTQYMARFHLGDNDQGYSFGDRHEITAWAAYQWAPWISTSLRLTGVTSEKIDGIDANIKAPVQTADPDNYGGERIDLAVGVNLVGQEGFMRGHRLAFEIGAPIYQDLNGPQMEQDYTFTIGWQKAF